MHLIGSLVNALAIVAGSAAGCLLSRLGGRALGGPTGKRMETIIMQGVSLCVVYLGISGSLQGENSLIPILSMILGGVLGEALDLDGKLQTLGEWVQERASGLSRDGEPSIANGFVSASLLFCVGAMGIMGSLREGLTGDPSILLAKALLDGVISVIMSTAMGVGVALSAIPVLLYQGGITLAASALEPVLNTGSVIAEMTCAGSLLILALGLNMLGLTKIKVMNLAPAAFLPILLCRFL